MDRLSIRSLSARRIWMQREKSAPSAVSVSTFSARSSTKPATAARVAAITFDWYVISRRLCGPVLNELSRFSIPRGRFSGAAAIFLCRQGNALSGPLPAFAHYRIAEGADAGDFDLDRVAMLEVLRGAFGPHPHHIAGLECQILRHPADEGGGSKKHVVGLEADLLCSVDADPGFGRIEIKIGLDPRAHWLEGVGVLGAPQGAVVGLPSAFAHVVTDRPSEDA